MKKIVGFTICFFLLAALFGVEASRALVRIEGDAAGLSIHFAEGDDENDTDQSFSAQRQEIIRINNHSRRYVGVTLQYCTEEGDEEFCEYVDNGPNDLYIKTSAKIGSLGTLEAFADWTAGLGDLEPPPGIRHYVLPVPDDLQPGQKAIYRVNALGLAWGKQLPFSIRDNHVPLEETLLIRSSMATIWEMLILPLISQLSGEYLKDYPATKLLVSDIAGFEGMRIDFISACEDGSISGALQPLVKYVAGSTLLEELMKAEGLNPNTFLTAEHLSQLKEWLLTPLTLLEQLNVLIHLATNNMLEEFAVFIIPPRVDSIFPDRGVAGDTVTINGAGFDPYSMENNRVFFTGLNDQGQPNPMAEAEILGADADALTLVVPDDFIPGPVMVCTQNDQTVLDPTQEAVVVFCSEWDVEFGEAAPPSLVIISPEEGEQVLGAVNVTVEVSNPPDPFPANSPATLSVDGTTVDEQWISAPDFGLSFNTDGLSEGTHTLEVMLTLGGEELSASVDIQIIEEGSGGTTEIDIGPEFCSASLGSRIHQAFIPWEGWYEPVNVKINFPLCNEPIGPGSFPTWSIWSGFMVRTSLQRYRPDYDIWISDQTVGYTGVPGKSLQITLDEDTNWQLRFDSFYNYRDSRCYYPPVPMSYTFIDYDGRLNTTRRFWIQVDAWYSDCPPFAWPP